MTLDWTELDTRAVDTARILSADAVEKVGNGHPGTPISLAPVAYLLYQKIMKLDPTDDTWLGRDRFVLSIGHASLAQYCQLHLAGADLELDDLKSASRVWPHPVRRVHHRAPWSRHQQRCRHGDGRAQGTRPVRSGRARG